MSARTEPKPWDRALGESAKAYSYFQAYIALEPAERSIGKVAAELRRPKRNLEYCSSRWRWAERVDAWDRHQDAINFARFEKLRERAAQRRLERELQREEEAGQVADRMFERGMQMLAWPIHEETVVEKTEVTPDGQHLHIHQRILRPVKWDLNALARFIETMDKISKSAVVDATKEQAPQGVTDDQIVERHFTLFTPDQVQLPKPPEVAVRATEEKQDDWTVDYGDAPARSNASPVSGALDVRP